MTIQNNPYNSQLYVFVSTLLERTQEGKINWERTGGRTYRGIGGGNITVISGSDSKQFALSPRMYSLFLSSTVQSYCTNINQESFKTNWMRS